MGESGLLGDLRILDLETNEWRRFAAGKAPPARRFHVAFFHEGTLYVAGGVREDGKPRRDLDLPPPRPPVLPGHRHLGGVVLQVQERPADRRGLSGLVEYRAPR